MISKRLDVERIAAWTKASAGVDRRFVHHFQPPGMMPAPMNPRPRIRRPPRPAQTPPSAPARFRLLQDPTVISVMTPTGLRAGDDPIRS